MEIKDMMVWAALDGMTKEQLIAKLDQAKDDMNDAMHLMKAVTVRLAALHLAVA